MKKPSKHDRDHLETHSDDTDDNDQPEENNLDAGEGSSSDDFQDDVVNDYDLIWLGVGRKSSNTVP
jgi:hypothetical protein